MLHARRMHHQSGPVIRVPMLAGVRCFQGDFEGADDAIAAVVEAGVLFERPGPAVLVMSLIYRSLISAMRGEINNAAGMIRPLLSTSRLVVTDVHALPSYCAISEIGNLI